MDSNLKRSILLEHYQNPKNRGLIDDNSYIKINMKEDYPHFEITRKLNKNDKYFGPFMAGVSAKEVLSIIDYAFPLRKCKLKLAENGKPLKPCLFKEMHLCSAPCAHLISKEDYHKVVEEAINFLKGDTKQVEQLLQTKMEQASANQNYETALLLRDRLKMLTKLKATVLTSLNSLKDYDVFNLVTSGEFSAMCVLTIRGGKLQGVQSYDILKK